jgi:biotin operon repressor
MPFQSTLSKLLLFLSAFIIFLFAIDILFFQTQNIQIIATTILDSFTANPLLSWGITFFLGAIIGLIAFGIYSRRRGFLLRLRAELDEAERVTLIEIARKLEVTPAKIELKIQQLEKSRVRKLGGLLIFSQGKHVYIGENLLAQITKLYSQGLTRGEVAGSLEIVRYEIDKAIDHLIEQGIVEGREEKRVEKVRPSYRRGTR